VTSTCSIDGALGEKCRRPDTARALFSTHCGGFFESKIDGDAERSGPAHDARVRRVEGSVSQGVELSGPTCSRSPATSCSGTCEPDIAMASGSTSRSPRSPTFLTTPASRMTRNVERTRVVEALRRLPVEQQTLLELYYWQELDIDAISEVFELEPGTTRVRLHRAAARSCASCSS